MSYVALYRKFRPDTFEEVKGQDHIVTTLRNQIRTGRIGHAYLFCGTRGTGKTTVAKILARAVNCEHPVDGAPCGTCEMCKRIREGRSLNVVEIDAASNNGVDNIRDIVEEVAYRPTEGKYRVYIIDEVHMLSTGAFNALLKTLEEPPSYVIFILATTESSKIPVTIRSRCQRYDFHRISADVITERLKELTEREEIRAEEKGLRYIARLSEGAMRDALSLLDQCASFLTDEVLTYGKVLEVLGSVDASVFRKMTDAIYKGDTAGTIRIFGDALSQGKDASQFVSDLTWYLRNLLLAKTAGEGADELIDLPQEEIRELHTLAEQYRADVIMRYIRSLAELTGQIRFAQDKRVQVEIALIKLCLPQVMADNADMAERVTRLDAAEEMLLDRIEELERALKNGSFVQQAPSAVPHAAEPAEETQEAEEEFLIPAPEELQNVCSRWNEILSAMNDRLAAKLLLTAIPRFDAESNDGVLYVELTSALGERVAGKPEVAESLRKAIRRRCGTDVKVELHWNDPRDKQLARIPVGEALRSRIHMEIEEES